MSWDKVVKSAALSTLAAVGLLLAFMLSALSLIFPSTLMKMSYKLGMDKSSISFATTAYERTGEVYYIAYATEVAIGSDMEKKIVSCGESFISDDEFASYCERENKNLPADATGTYEQYVYTQVCVAMYELGNKDAAVMRAFELVGNGFPRNNPVAALVVMANKESDTQTVQKIKGSLENLQKAELSEVDTAYLTEILAFIG